MDFPLHIDIISMGLSIVHYKGSQVEFILFYAVLRPWRLF